MGVVNDSQIPDVIREKNVSMKHQAISKDQITHQSMNH